MLSASLLVEAQTISENVEKGAVQSWEIGTDLLWLIDKNQVPTSVFVRSNYVTKKNKLRAWRLRLGLNMSYRDSITINRPFDNELNNISIFARVGYEWQHKVEEKVLLYYGADVGFSYSGIYEKRILTLLPPPGRLYQETFTTYQPSFIGFIGCRYDPKPWISFSLEASLQIAYRIRRNPFKTTSIDFPDDEGAHGFYNAEELIINLLPITYLNISFNINKK